MANHFLVLSPVADCVYVCNGPICVFSILSKGRPCKSRAAPTNVVFPARGRVRFCRFRDLNGRIAQMAEKGRRSTQASGDKADCADGGPGWKAAIRQTSPTLGHVIHFPKWCASPLNEPRQLLFADDAVRLETYKKLF